MSAAARSPRRQAALTGVIALLGYLATTGGSLATTDAVVTYEVTQNLLRHGSTALTEGRMTEEQMRGVDGRYYSPFGIGQSIYNIPFYLAGDAVTRLTGIRVGAPDTLTKAAVCVGSAFAAAGCVWVSCLFAWHVSRNARAAAFAGLLLAFGSALWPYSKFGFGAPLTALCLAAGVYGAWLGVAANVSGKGHARRAPLAWGGAWLGFALLTRHEMLLAAAAVVAWVWWFAPPAGRVKTIAAIAAGPVAAAVVWLVYNEIRFGNPLYAGHRPGFGATGFAGLLFSPGGSLFLYSPVAIAGAAALLSMWWHDRRTALLFGSVVLVLFTFYAALEDWLGTRSYGPRYTVALLPLLCVPLAPAIADGSRKWGSAVAAAALAGVLIQVPGVMVDPGKVNVALGRPGPITVEERRWEWTLSAIVLNAKAAASQSGPNLRYVLGVEPRPELAPAATGESFSQRLAFSLDFWWLYLFHLGVLPAVAALAAPLALLAVAAWLTRRLDWAHNGG